MYEKRQFFRIKNNGQIQATQGSHALEVIDISSSGVLIKKNDRVPKAGILELTIQYAFMSISYELLRSEEDNMVLIFKNQNEIEALFLILKQLKDEGKV